MVLPIGDICNKANARGNLNERKIEAISTKNLYYFVLGNLSFTASAIVFVWL